MAAPNRHSRSFRQSSTNESFQITLPTTVKGDILYLVWAGDGINTGMEDVCGQFVGWNRSFIANSTTVMCYGRLYKIADGTEGGTTLTMTSPSEKWCIEAGAISGAHIDADFTTSWATGSSTSPNPPSEGGYSDPIHDVLQQAFAVSDGSGTFSAVPSTPAGFVSVARLNNGAADGVALDYAERTVLADVDDVDPSAFTKSTSSAWAATTCVFIDPVVAPGTSATIRDEKAQVLTGTVLDFPTEITAGFFCAALQNATLAQTTSVVLDPGGPEQRTLTLVTDGVTQAAVGGGPGTIAWYQLDPDDMPPLGTYTLRVTLTTSLTCGLFAFNVQNAREVVDVLNVSHASSASGTVDTIVGDLILVAAGQVANAPGGVPKQGEPWVTRTINTSVLFPRLSAWYATDYVTVFARRSRSVTTNTITVAATTVNLSAIVLQFRLEPEEDVVVTEDLSAVFGTEGLLEEDIVVSEDLDVVFQTQEDLEEDLSVSEDLSAEFAYDVQLEEDLSVSEDVSAGFEVRGSTSLSSTQVQVDFTSSYNPNAAASSTSSYTIPGLDVLEVFLVASSSILLITSPQNPDTPYVLTVSEDLLGFGGDPLNPSANTASFEGYSATPFIAVAQSAQRVQLTFATEMQVDAAFVDPANYTLARLDGSTLTVGSVEAIGLENRHASLTLENDLSPNNSYTVTVGPDVRTSGDEMVLPATVLFTWTPYAPSPIVLDFERFSGEVSGGLLGQPAGQVFFSPAFEQSAANSILEVDQVSVCTRAYDTYEFPELPDPPILYTFPAPNSPQTSSLLNGTTILFAPAERQGLARVNLTYLPEDAYTPPVDGPADAALVETIDITRAGFLNDVRWKTFPADTAEIGVFTTADNLTPIGPGPTSNINLQP